MPSAVWVAWGRAPQFLVVYLDMHQQRGHEKHHRTLDVVDNTEEQIGWTTR